MQPTWTLKLYAWFRHAAMSLSKRASEVVLPSKPGVSMRCSHHVTVAFKHERLHELGACCMHSSIEHLERDLETMVYFYVLAHTLENKYALSGPGKSDNSDNDSFFLKIVRVITTCQSEVLFLMIDGGYLS